MRIIALLLFNCIFCVQASDLGHLEFSYQANTPSQTFIMPKELEEISGLSISDDGKYLVAVQDEDGIIFYLDKNTGKVERQVEFWDSGDYEGVEVVGKTVYVVKSTGTIYEIPESGKDVQKYKFGLDSENDVEGLAYDAKNNRLLLACKKKVGGGINSGNKRGIYAFDLSTKSMSETPVYIIAAQEVQSFLSPQPNTDTKEKLLECFESEDMKFAPSAIAIHPRTGHLYLLSSAGNVLLILDENGKVLHAEKLKKKSHLQPEGICFDAEETMYISNEGKDGEPGKIHVFKTR